MLRPTHPAGTCGRFIRIVLQPRDETGEIICRNVVLGDDQVWSTPGERYRFEVLHHVVCKRVDCAIRNVRAPIAHADGVTIWRGSRDPANANRSIRASNIFDDYILTERCPHGFSHDTRSRIRRPACSESDDHRDGSRRIDLRRGVPDTPQNGGNGDRKCDAFQVTLQPSNHSGFAPENLTTLVHFSVSSAMSLPNSEGEPTSAVPPSSANRAFILGSPNATLISWLSLSMTTAGVRLGAPIPNHALAS